MFQLSFHLSLLHLNNVSPGGLTVTMRPKVCPNCRQVPTERMFKEKLGFLGGKAGQLEVLASPRHVDQSQTSV